MATISKDPTAIPNQQQAVPVEPAPHTSKIDPTAPAGSPNSLGAESIRDGRPASDDSIVEAMDEEGPSLTSPRNTAKSGNK